MCSALHSGNLQCCSQLTLTPTGTITGTTGAADPQLQWDNNPPNTNTHTAPVNTIFACLYFHSLLLLDVWQKMRRKHAEAHEAMFTSMFFIVTFQISGQNTASLTDQTNRLSDRQGQNQLNFLSNSKCSRCHGDHKDAGEKNCYRLHTVKTSEHNTFWDHTNVVT